MINAVVARTPILILILMFTAVGYAVAQNRVVVIPLGADVPDPVQVPVPLPVSGYEIIRLRITVNPDANSTSFGGVECPLGKNVVGGGAVTLNARHLLQGSYPGGDGTQWIVAVAKRNGETTAAGFAEIYAICVDTIS